METKKESLKIVDKIKKFLLETTVEGKKVIWPERKFVVTATIVILIIVMLVAMFVMTVDFGLAEIFKVLTQTFGMRTY